MEVRTPTFPGTATVGGTGVTAAVGEFSRFFLVLLEIMNLY
jgi:hypothetical protein